LTTRKIVELAAFQEEVLQRGDAPKQLFDRKESIFLLPTTKEE
jgi:hypothetical protein